MKIPLFKIYWDEDDISAVANSIRRGMNWACGPNIEKFENATSKYLGINYAVVFNSATSALHALMLAYGIGSGDEVIVPSFTFIATSNTPLFVGAKPVFADIEEETFGLDPKDVEKKITKRTKAIIPIHYVGCPCKIKELKKIAKKYNLLLIEDAAGSFGAKIDGKPVGTFGEAAIFSFCQNKIFTTGEGGGAVTKSGEIYQKLKLIRSHGRAEDAGYFSARKYIDYLALGYNFRMSDMAAALGISQIKKVNKLIQTRRNNAKYMTSSLLKLGIDDIIIPQFPANIYHVYQEYPVKIKSGKKTRDALKDYLAKKGIGTIVHFCPVHLTHFYKNILGYKDKLEITKKLSDQVLSLPIYPGLTKREIDYMANEIKNFYNQASERRTNLFALPSERR